MYLLPSWVMVVVGRGLMAYRPGLVLSVLAALVVLSASEDNGLALLKPDSEGIGLVLTLRSGVFAVGVSHGMIS